MPSVSPSALGCGEITGGLSSIVKSCSDSVDGGRHPLTTASVLFVGVPFRTMPQPVSKRCVASRASTRVTPSAGVVAPRTPIAIRKIEPGRVPRRRERNSDAHADRHGGVEVDHPSQRLGDRRERPAASRSTNGSAVRGIRGKREIVRNGAAHDVGERLPLEAASDDEAIGQHLGARDAWLG